MLESMIVGALTALISWPFFALLNKLTRKNKKKEEEETASAVEEKPPVPAGAYTWTCTHCGYDGNGVNDYSCRSCGKGKA